MHERNGEGFGGSWYPSFNSGVSAFFTIYAGAEMTCQEVRFIPVVIMTAVNSYGGKPEKFEEFISTRKRIPPPESFPSKPIDRVQFLEILGELLV